MSQKQGLWWSDTSYSLLSVDSVVSGVLRVRGTGEQHGERQMESSEVCDCKHSIIIAKQLVMTAFGLLCLGQTRVLHCWYPYWCINHSAVSWQFALCMYNKVRKLTPGSKLLWEDCSPWGYAIRMMNKMIPKKTFLNKTCRSSISRENKISINPPSGKHCYSTILKSTAWNTGNGSKRWLNATPPQCLARESPLGSVCSHVS